MVPKLRRPLVLTGFWGAGKTTIGKELADRLGVPFVDIDQWIERKVGLKISDLIREEGLLSFRNRETKALELQLLLPPYGVIALGGGALLKESNLQTILDKGHLLWLQCHLGEAWQRILMSPQTVRPFLPQHCRNYRELIPAYSIREPGYRSAHWNFDTTGRSVSEVVDRMTDYLIRYNHFIWEEPHLWMAN